MWLNGLGVKAAVVLLFNLQLRLNNKKDYSVRLGFLASKLG